MCREEWEIIKSGNIGLFPNIMRIELQKKMAHCRVPRKRGVINIRARNARVLDSGVDEVVDGVDNESLEFIQMSWLLCIVDPRDDVFSTFDLLV